MDFLSGPSRAASPRADATPTNGEPWEAEVVQVVPEGVYVLIPEYDPDRRWGPCPFNRAVPPAVGDRCLVVQTTNTRRLWVL